MGPRLWWVKVFVLSACAAVPGARSPAVVPFAEGMSRPVFDPARLAKNLYTPAAIQESVEGLLIARCHVMSDGRVQNCRLLKSLPHLGPRVVERLESMPMAPARRDGIAISVDYVFNLSFKLPRD